ncbi:hypothetical protein F4818DRAFT_351864 [Hypoxylon cercidicola]|nr:hypothetical protein F4818DRAFT_351864 [Hypoxylon cercidicola]
MTLAVILTTAALGVARLAGAQGIVANCTWQNGFMQDSFLGMYCNNDNWADYSYDWSWLDTNVCLTNYDGKLHPSDIGHYWGTCGNCSVRPSPKDFVLHCECLDHNAAWTPTTYDLNTLVYNRNGTLGCFDFLGNKTRIGPF